MAAKLIWDLPTRLFHWSLVALICGSYYTVEVTGDMDAHMTIGKAILTLVLFRVVWGFIGTRYARFDSFLAGPRAIVAYAKSLGGRDIEEYAGHNPLGGAVVMVMLALLLAQTGSGLFATDGEIYSGPLNDLISRSAGNGVTEFHEVNFTILMLVAAVHVAAAFFYLIVKRVNLIAPMITGRKPGSGDAIEGSRLVLAVFTLVAVAVGVVATLALL